jgi:plastocyanin
MANLRTTFTALATLALAVPVAAATIEVGMENRQFVPAVVFIQPGDTVHWTNNDSRNMSHTVTSGPEGMPDGRFDSGTIATAGTYSYTFAAAGGVPYYCDFHGGMTGLVVVGPAVEMAAGRVFNPASLAVAVGDTVTWANVDTMGHTSTSGVNGVPDLLWDSGNVAPRGWFSYTFTAAGQYPYYCDFHLPGMVGLITVGSPASGACCAGTACQVTSPTSCASLPGGAYQGDNTLCTPDPCATPLPAVVKLVKDPADRTSVRLEWTGTAAMLHRGVRADLPAGLPMLRALGAMPDFDNGVVPPPAPDYYYQAQ